MADRIRRSVAAQLGRETVAIVDDGGYATARGRVDLRPWTEAAVAGTKDYPARDPVPEPGPHDPLPTAFEVRNETTLDAARRLARHGIPAALNFASAYHPGGGFLGGARAQEESLARSSALFACLRGSSMYAHHQTNRNPMYTAWVIHAPAVPVFRTDAGDLLDEPYRCAFVTSAAVNAKIVLQRDPSRATEIEGAMRERVDRVLRVAVAHGHESLVLGAWGCGVFGNDPSMVAELFSHALRGPYRDRFARVVFAIVDWTRNERIIGPFRAAFAESSLETEIP